MAVREYEMKIAIDKKEIYIKDSIETNFLEGQALQMATLFYRTMLAYGFPPSKASDAMGRVAASGGYVAFGDVMQDEFDFGSTDGGES